MPEFDPTYIISDDGYSYSDPVTVYRSEVDRIYLATLKRKAEWVSMSGGTMETLSLDTSLVPGTVRGRYQSVSDGKIYGFRDDFYGSVGGDASGVIDYDTGSGTVYYSHEAAGYTCTYEHGFGTPELWTALSGSTAWSKVSTIPIRVPSNCGYSMSMTLNQTMFCVGASIDSIYKTQSIDYGQTWRRPEKVNINLAGLTPVRFVDVTTMDTGRLNIIFTAGQSAYTSYSKDGGESWSEPIEVESDIDYGFHPVRIYQDALSGSLLVASLSDKGDGKKAYLKGSSDRGESWIDFGTAFSLLSVSAISDVQAVRMWPLMLPDQSSVLLTTNIGESGRDCLSSLWVDAFILDAYPMAAFEYPISDYASHTGGVSAVVDGDEKVHLVFSEVDAIRSGLKYQEFQPKSRDYPTLTFSATQGLEAPQTVLEWTGSWETIKTGTGIPSTAEAHYFYDNSADFSNITSGDTLLFGNHASQDADKHGYKIIQSVAGTTTLVVTEEFSPGQLGNSFEYKVVRGLPTDMELYAAEITNVNLARKGGTKLFSKNPEEIYYGTMYYIDTAIRKAGESRYYTLFSFFNMYPYFFSRKMFVQDCSIYTGMKDVSNPMTLRQGVSFRDYFYQMIPSYMRDEERVTRVLPSGTTTHTGEILLPDFDLAGDQRHRFLYMMGAYFQRLRDSISRFPVFTQAVGEAFPEFVKEKIKDFGYILEDELTKNYPVATWRIASRAFRDISRRVGTESAVKLLARLYNLDARLEKPYARGTLDSCKSVVSGTGVTSGDNVLYVTGVDLTDLGVKSGDKLVLSNTPDEGNYLVESVPGATALTISTSWRYGGSNPDYTIYSGAAFGEGLWDSYSDYFILPVYVSVYKNLQVFGYPNSFNYLPYSNPKAQFLFNKIKRVLPYNVVPYYKDEV